MQIEMNVKMFRLLTQAKMEDYLNEISPPSIKMLKFPFKRKHSLKMNSRREFLFHHFSILPTKSSKRGWKYKGTQHNKLKNFKIEFYYQQTLFYL